MNLEQLERIYNTFALIETKGNNTIIMGQALNALKNYIQESAAMASMPPQDDEKE